uniref:Uncharacterized protein n=1 Tax=Dulem virus 42 TaxID=3145760 RepID=A0AAU8BAM0_9CAUD
MYKNRRHQIGTRYYRMGYISSSSAKDRKYKSTI